MDARSIILKKKEGGELSRDELQHVIMGYTRGSVPDYQMSAWLMAVLWRGMTEAETHDMTEVMVNSGKVIRPENLPSPSVDKHSTGGVGDKVSLALAPLVASAGACVPMLSGRGLGHTGGTLDKIESLPGFKTDLTTEDFITIVHTVGACIAAQGEEMTPADGKIYALRDVTGTVESVPLIVSSIVSKKVAEGAKSIVYDVKWGRGAFMTDLDDAVKLASALVEETLRHQRNAMALVTDMNQPLGQAVGNALEMREAVAVLKGCGPSDVTALTLMLGGAMLCLAGLAGGIRAGAEIVKRKLRSGEGLQKMRAMVSAQGGDARCVDEASRIPVSSCAADVECHEDGYVGSIDTKGLGFLVCDMGGGRHSAGQRIDPGVGALILKKEGDRVIRGEVLARLFLAEASHHRDFVERAAGLFELQAERPVPRPLIAYKVTGEGAQPLSDALIEAR